MNLYRAAIKELRTVRDLLRFAVSRFQQAQLHYGHGTSNAYDEAAYLILHTLHLPIDSLNPYLDARLTESEREAIVQVLERRVKERIPAPYLTQEAWLQGHAFYVDQRVIVPRSFIAELLLDQLTPWVQDPDQVGQILELCTGSGCLSIIAAEVFPNAQIIAADISPAALEVARKNVDTYGLQARIRLLESDLFAQVPKKKYDLILVNPPYVPASSMDALPAEFRAEPELALAGGQDGLDLVHRLLSEADPYLKKNGVMLVEVGHERPAVEAAYPHLPLTWLTTSAGDDMVFLYSR
jgi:ribosomal protein L3 glutamine methyltransferase